MAEQDLSAIDIGRRIADLRQARGLKVVDLAKAIGLTENGVREIEKGRASRQYMQLALIARTLGTTPNHLLGFQDLPLADQGDQLDMMGAAVQVMLIDDGWPRDRAEALVDIATEVAIEKNELELDRRLAAAFRRHALKPRT